VNIIFKQGTKSDLISSYDGVLLATGSEPVVPSIPGLNKFYWADILLEENLPQDKKVLIIGGGLISKRLKEVLYMLKEAERKLNLMISISSLFPRV
jgi:pyruvate/2-oxoglutarate dehydrogenase complex dihydrolipoamide dehydrogenase (E3) component